MALVQYWNVVQANDGSVIENASVMVYMHDGVSPATLYETESGLTQISNPLYSDEDGMFSFAAEDGEYWIGVQAIGFNDGEEKKLPIDLVDGDIEDSVNIAYRWAEYPEDQPVPEGDGTEYSAHHWAAKTAEDVVLTANSASAAATSETNAANSASAAATSETNAASSASAAATSETNAANSASAAATSETNAATSETNAAASADSAAASYDSFDDRYLGAKSVEPTLDNDGNTLLVGALYFSSITNKMNVWDGAKWSPTATGALINKVEETLTAAKSSFAIEYDVSLGVEVYHNGIKLEPAAYTATDGLNVVLNTAAEIGDHVSITAYIALAIADIYTKAEVDGLVSDHANLVGTEAHDLGTASTLDVTTSPTDTTAGRLLKVGDFGVGGSLVKTADYDVADDLDVLAKNCTFQTTSTTLNVPYGAGTSVGQFYGYHLQHQNGSYATQYCTQLINNRSFFRVKKADVWEPWQEIYHTGNILGTVSQDAGVPTGAIIERGSNSDGEYVKYADGTLICVSYIGPALFDITSTAGPLYKSAFNLTWTPPHAFTELPKRVGSITDGAGAHTNVFAIKFASNTYVYEVWSTASLTAVSPNHVITGIGRWY